MLPVEQRAKLSRGKLYRKIRGNTKPPAQLQRHDTAPWEQLPYDCRIDWTRKGTEIRSQPDDNTYYTDGSSDGTRVTAAVVHKEEIIIRLNDSASVLGAEMTDIQVALENTSETRDKITIHTDSLTAVNILNNRSRVIQWQSIRPASERSVARVPAQPGRYLFCYIGDTTLMSKLCYDHIPLDTVHKHTHTSCYDRTTSVSIVSVSFAFYASSGELV